jgi:hypothetical protein
MSIAASEMGPRHVSFSAFFGSMEDTPGMDEGIKFLALRQQGCRRRLGRSKLLTLSRW